MKTEKISLISVLMFFALKCIGQSIFKDEIKLPCTYVDNQTISGICWSHPTPLFIESGKLETNKKGLELLQMMIVRVAYLKMTLSYIMRQWGYQPDCGGFAPGALCVMKNYQMIPQAAYSGLTVVEKILDLWELDPVLKTFLNEVIKVSFPGCSIKSCALIPLSALKQFSVTIPGL